MASGSHGMSSDRRRGARMSQEFWSFDFPILCILAGLVVGYIWYERSDQKRKLDREYMAPDTAVGRVMNHDISVLVILLLIIACPILWYLWLGMPK